jgi:hypothetical protein
MFLAAFLILSETANIYQAVSFLTRKLMPLATV